MTEVTAQKFLVELKGLNNNLDWIVIILAVILFEFLLTSGNKK